MRITSLQQLLSPRHLHGKFWKSNVHTDFKIVTCRDILNKVVLPTFGTAMTKLILWIDDLHGSFHPRQEPNLMWRLMIGLIAVRHEHFPVYPWKLSHTYALCCNSRHWGRILHLFSMNIRCWKISYDQKTILRTYLAISQSAVWSIVLYISN